jgi:ferredoxin-NADP reductase
MNYDVKLLSREEIAEDIMTVYFEKPDKFEFLAGQFCFLKVPDIGFQDERGLRRHLSIASSPLEKELMFATKMSNSAFKRTLKEMPIGNIIIIEAPRGFLILPEDTLTPLIFLAGGIGITPFRSMIRYVADASTGHIIKLFYSNRIPEEAAFLKELQSIADTLKNITIIPTMTRTDRPSASWSGLTERISSSMIRDSFREWRDAVYYVAGPPAMVDSMKEMLKGMNIQSDRIHIESFTGY